MLILRDDVFFGKHTHTYTIIEWDTIGQNECQLNLKTFYEIFNQIQYTKNTT